MADEKKFRVESDLLGELKVPALSKKRKDSFSIKGKEKSPQ